MYIVKVFENTRANKLILRVGGYQEDEKDASNLRYELNVVFSQLGVNAYAEVIEEDKEQ